MSYSSLLILSLGLHLAIFWALSLVPQVPPPDRATKVEIVYTDASQKKKQTFVEDTDLGKVVEELREKAEFLSKLNRRVEKQMVATKNGETKNSKKQIPTRDLLPKYEKKDVAGMGKPLTLPQGTAFDESTISQHIPNVDKAGMTALNTGSFRYYTFFRRIGEQIRPRWVSRVSGYGQSLSTAALNKLSRSMRITEIEVLLDMTGMFVTAKVNRSSGDTELDRIAVNSVENAAPFRNPPLELVEADGYIHLYYGFYVQWAPRYLAKDR